MNSVSFGGYSLILKFVDGQFLDSINNTLDAIATYSSIEDNGTKVYYRAIDSRASFADLDAFDNTQKLGDQFEAD